MALWYVYTVHTACLRTDDDRHTGSAGSAWLLKACCDPLPDLAASFQREVGFYELLLADETAQLLAVPRCRLALRQPPIGHHEQPPGGTPSSGFSLVLEDLRELGFHTASMDAGLSLAQTSTVLRQLATFHARFAGIAGEPEPPVLALTTAQLAAKADIHCTPQALGAFVSHYCSDCTAEEREGFDSAMRAALEHGAGRLFAAAVDRAGGLISLNHGDVHPLNLMFGSSSGEVPEVRLVDFADIAWTSPAYDVQQCLSCCLDAASRRTHESQLLQEYTDALHRCNPRLMKGGWDGEVFASAVQTLGALSCLQIAGYFGGEKVKQLREDGEGLRLDATVSPLAARLVAMASDGDENLQELAATLH